MMHSILPWLLVLMMSAGISFFGSTTGGIGLIVVPGLMAFGFPPHLAVATMRFAILPGDLIGLHVFHRAGKVNSTLAFRVTIISMVGAGVGAVLLLETPGPLTEKLFGIFLLCMCIYSFLRRDLGVASLNVTSRKKNIGYLALFGVSMLGAFFSMAGGLLGRTVLMTHFGQTYLQSSAIRKIQGIAGGVVAILIFAWSGTIDLLYGSALASGFLLGTFFGVRYALRKGEAWSKHLFLIVMLFSGVWLLF